MFNIFKSMFMEVFESIIIFILDNLTSILSDKNQKQNKTTLNVITL